MNATSTLPERPPRRGGLVGPAILVGLGVVLLLNNLGVVGWEVWQALLRLWPLLLIAVGLDLLFGRRSRLGSALVALVMLAALVAIIWASGSWLGGGTALTGETVGQALGQASRAEVEVAMSVGALRVDAGAAPRQLVEGTLARAPREEIARDFWVTGDTAHFTLRSRGRSGAFVPLGGESSDVVWDLHLNPEVPMQLKLSTGAGAATLDLSRAHLSDLEVNIGVGRTELTLPWLGVVTARVNGGIGETTIIIPAGVAASIEANAGLGKVQVSGDYARTGTNSYRSPGYDSATNRVDLKVNGGIGAIIIQQGNAGR